MDDIWFEKEMENSVEDDENLKKGWFDQNPLENEPKIRVFRPRWKYLGRPEMQSGLNTGLWVVRLSFELDSCDKHKDFEYARCEAFLEPENTKFAPPEVYDLYPQAIYDGEPQTVTLEFSPGIKVKDSIELTLGKIGTEIQVGRVAPVTLAFKGEQARNPQWRMEAKRHKLIGPRDFFILVENPLECGAFHLRVRVEAVISGHRVTAMWPLIVVKQDI